MGYNRQKRKMKPRFLCLIALTMLNLDLIAQSAYVVPNIIPGSPKDYQETSSSDERFDNISATFGLDGEWSFILYSDGTFRSRDWYGYHGHFDTNFMRDITTSSGTYYITRNEHGERIVHFRFRNGKEKTGSIRYTHHGEAKLSYAGKTHSEIQ